MLCPKYACSNNFRPFVFIMIERTVIMSITVKDLFQYNPNFDPKKIEYLTGKKNYDKKDTINLSRVEGLNDIDFSIFVADKEGKSFVNSIKDDKMKISVTKAIGDDNNQEQNKSVSADIPMDKSIFDLKKV